MKIAYTSDLHIDASERNREAVVAIARHMTGQNPDVVVIAGDAGNTLEDLEDVLECFAHLSSPKFFVAGNHDVWVENRADRRMDSRQKYEREIPALCDRMGFVDLSRGPAVVDGVGFVGSIGWYDYSFADPRLHLTAEQYWRGRHGEEIWWDREMAFWPPSDMRGARTERVRDPGVCEEMVATLGRHLDELPADVECVVAVVHTLPFVETLPRSDPPYYLDAFTGSASLGRLLASHPMVTHTIGGHKHISGDWTVGRVQAHRRILGRLRDDLPIVDAAESAVGVISV